MDSNAKKNLTNWRKLVNQGGTMEQNDIVLPNNDESPESDSKKPPKKKSRKEARRTVTLTNAVGLV